MTLVPTPLPPDEDRTFSDVLESLGHGDDPKLTLKEMVEAFGERGFGAVILMLSLMALVEPEEGEDALFARLRTIRPQAWPNSVMIGFADAQLGRGGRLTQALRRHYAHQIEAQPQFRTWMNDLGRKREIEMGLGL